MNKLNMNNLLKGLRVGAIFAVFAFVSAGSINAQPTGTGSGSGTSTGTSSSMNDRNDNTEWGWAGLLGLVGLVGLIPKKRVVDTHRNDNR